MCKLKVMLPGVLCLLGVTPWAVGQMTGSAPATPALVVHSVHGSVTVKGQSGVGNISWSAQRHPHAGAEGGVSVNAGHGVTEISSEQAADVVVTVPASLQRLSIEADQGDISVANVDSVVRMETGGGKLTTENVKGRQELETGGGAIVIRRNGSMVIAQTGGGSILVDAGNGDIQAATAGGTISVTAIRGSARLETGGGTITVHQASGNVKLSTGGGNIELGNIGGDVDAQTMGGEIRLASAGGSVKAFTSSGLVDCRNLMGGIHAETHEGRIVAEYSRDVRHPGVSHLETTSGNITVAIPDGAAMTVKAVVRNPGGEAIQSELPGIHTQNTGDGGELVAGGSLNGGGAVLSVEAENGSVRFVRSH